MQDVTSTMQLDSSTAKPSTTPSRKDLCWDKKKKRTKVETTLRTSSDFVKKNQKPLLIIHSQLQATHSFILDADPDTLWPNQGWWTDSRGGCTPFQGTCCQSITLEKGWEGGKVYCYESISKESKWRRVTVGMAVGRDGEGVVQVISRVKGNRSACLSKLVSKS